MNKVEIKSEGPCEVTLNGKLVAQLHEDFGLIFGDTPDRITITLTEREAGLVRALIGHHVTGTSSTARSHTDAVHRALVHTGVDDISGLFDGIAFGAGAAGPSRYASIKRDFVSPDGSIAKGEHRIALTMDRDVAVTLKHLLLRLKPLGELAEVYDKLSGAYVAVGGPDRFTGTITWRKKRLVFGDLEDGKTYRLIKGRDIFAAEWEEVE